MCGVVPATWQGDPLRVPVASPGQEQNPEGRTYANFVCVRSLTGHISLAFIEALTMPLLP
jgi:hypothetical protein